MSDLLTDYAQKIKKKTSAKPEWTPPQYEDFTRTGIVVAVDQTVTKSGVVVLDLDRLTVLASRSLATERVDDGPLDTLKRAGLMQTYAEVLLAEFRPAVLVHELPPVISTRTALSRPESSWSAAMAWRSAAYALGMQRVTIAAQHHKKITCGNGNAKKEDHHKIMMPWAGELVSGIERVTNADERDALSIALTYGLEG